jgi:SMC interacting uncharacterized protein involved in chromosome segregation
MTIRMIAKELYALQQQLDRLEKQIKSETADKQEALKERLRQIRADRDRMRKVLDGKKEPCSFR